MAIMAGFKCNLRVQNFKFSMKSYGFNIFSREHDPLILSRSLVFLPLPGLMFLKFIKREIEKAVGFLHTQISYDIQITLFTNIQISHDITS